MMPTRAMRSYTLSQKIAILVTGVVVVMLATSIALTYRALLQSAEFEASQRVVGSALRVSSSFKTIAARVIDTTALVSKQPAMIGVFLATGDELEEASLRARSVLAPLRRLNRDTELP